MSDEELEQDDIEGAEDDDVEDVPADDTDVEEEDGDDDDVEVAPRGKSKAKAIVEEDLPSLEAKQSEREALAKAMEEFLARGGKVQEIDANVVADPPKKPDSKYGSRPI